MSAKALSAGTFMLNVPESEVVMPRCCPRMVTETLLNGDSLSSITFPLTVAPFFCEKQMVVDRIKDKNSFKRIKSTMADLGLK